MARKKVKRELIPAVDILQATKLQGKAGMFLLQQMAVYAGCIGKTLDATGILFDDFYYHEGSISVSVESYTRHLIEQGWLTGYDCTQKNGKNYSDIMVVETEMFNDPEFKIWDNNIWSYAWAKEHYGVHLTPRLTKYEHLEFFMIFMIAKKAVDNYINKTNEILTLDLKEFTNSILMYMTLLKLKEDMPQLPFEMLWEEYIINERGYDVQYKLFYDDCIESGKAGVYTSVEKQKFMEEAGFKEGAIVALYRRSCLSTYRPWGDIEDVRIAKYKGMKGDTVVFEIICVTRTKEDMWEQLMALPEEQRILCQDIYYEDAKTYEDPIPIYNLGIEKHLCCQSAEGSRELEPFILQKIDNRTETTLYTKMDGRLDHYKMKEYDAIHWLLKQNHYKFDEDLYHEMYGETSWESRH